MSIPSTYEEWYRTGVAAAIPWLAGGENGQLEAGAWPRFLDDIIVERLTQARYVAFPDYAPVDALPHLGGDRRLVQGSNEAQSAFRARLKNPWDQWARAGTWLGMLCQLYWFGVTNAVIVQQNGKQATLTGAPVIGTDPTSLYSFTDTSTLASVLTSTAAPYRSIPAGNPWFYLDGNTDMCNRFAVIIPSFPFARLGYANFTDSASATVTWPVPFPDTNYGDLIGVPTTVTGAVVNEDATLRTTSQITLVSSPNLTERIPVLAWESGINPFNVWSPSSTGLLKSIIVNWRPNALCMFVNAIQSGRVLGYPTTDKLGDVGAVLGGSISQILGVF